MRKINVLIIVIFLLLLKSGYSQDYKELLYNNNKILYKIRVERGDDNTQPSLIIKLTVNNKTNCSIYLPGIIKYIEPIYVKNENSFYFNIDIDGYLNADPLIRGDTLTFVKVSKQFETIKKIYLYNFIPQKDFNNLVGYELKFYISYINYQNNIKDILLSKSNFKSGEELRDFENNYKSIYLGSVFMTLN